MSDVEIRRNEIIELLYTYKKYSIDDFAKRFGVSRRTINYDIVYLMYFYEIDTKPGPHGGIFLINRRPNSHTGSRIKLVREHRGLTQQKLGEMLGYGKSSANRIAQYEMGYRSPKANRLKEIAKAMNIREEIFLMPDETPIDLLRILIWYDWEHEGVLQLATSRTANTPPGKTVSPIIYSEQLPLNRLLLDWADQKHSLSVRKITRADYLEWMLQWPPRLP